VELTKFYAVIQIVFAILHPAAAALTFSFYRFQCCFSSQQVLLRSEDVTKSIAQDNFRPSLHSLSIASISAGWPSVDDLSYICGVNNKPNCDSMYMTIRRLLSALLKYDTIMPSLMDKL